MILRAIQIAAFFVGLWILNSDTAARILVSILNGGH
jgi:hypothetical protein